MNLGRTATAIGTATALAAVVLGAFGSHALADRLGEHGRNLWRTAERYQFVHALALILLGVTASVDHAPEAILWLFVSGLVLFCGSLYALGLGASRRFGFAAPLGGLALLAGWALWLWSTVTAR